MSDNIKIGDKVRFLTSTGGGVVAGFQGKDIVLVEDEDGFQIPTLRKEVVVIDTDDYNIARVHRSASVFSANNRPSAQNDTSKQAVQPNDQPVKVRPKIEERKGGDQLSVYLAFVPVDVHEVSKTTFETYMVNDSNYYIHYAYLSAEGNSYKLRAEGEVEPNTKVFVEEFSRDVLNELEHVAVQLISYKRDKSFLLKPTIDVQLRIDGTKFYKLHTFQENEFFEQPALVYTLVENDRAARPLVIDAQQLKNEMYRQAQPARIEHPNDKTYVRRYDDGKGKPIIRKRRGDEDVVVVDLHINALLDSTAGMSSADMLNYQMDKVNETLKAYADKKGQRIVFVHGKGDGVLRRSIIHELKYRYKQYTYQDASFQEYGYGATQVTIK